MGLMRRMLSSRVNAVRESATIRMSAIAREMKRAGEKVLDFSLGEPDFDTPAHICEAAKKAMDEGFTHYTASAGIPELREAIAEKMRAENGVDASAENVIVTPGAKQAIFEAMLSVLDEGDEVILLEPAWVSFEAAVRIAGGNPKFLRRKEKSVNYEDLRAVVTEKTKMLVVNSPNNPVGYVMDERELREIAEFACDYNIIVLSDEVYEKIIYGKKHVSIASFEGMEERTIVVNGFSKTYAMTGWRVGYAVAPIEIVSAMTKMQQHSATCAPSISQRAALAALKGSQECVAEMVAEFKKRRDLIVKRLLKLGFSCEPMPEGAFYVFVGIPAHALTAAFGDSEASEGDEKRKGVAEDIIFAEWLLRSALVVATPGSAFGEAGRNHLRFSYATSLENIAEGMERLENLLSQ
ncbi:MAG: Aspartate/methionine/tyrosine aminotransferase [Methanophagales archaeon]|nr:Aspartate/methionine/tyrosine aminotransferase [Methanophagales archaeon]